MEQKEAKPWGIWLTAMLLALAMVCSLAAAALGWHRPAEAAECFGAQRPPAKNDSNRNRISQE